jgi:putative glycosyltransferase
MPPKLSVVTTLFKSREYISEFYLRTTNEAEKCFGDDFEIIFVDDGSPDDSDRIVRDLIIKNEKVRLISLSRNFGHHQAIHAGLDSSNGDLVFLIDCDLEEQPEWLSLFYEEIKLGGHDVVYGMQQKRKGDFFERISGSIWYALLNFCLDFEHPKNFTTARIMTKEYVEAFRNYTERTAILSGLLALTGFDQKAIPVKKLDTSRSTYTFRKKIGLVSSALTGLTNKPLYLIILGNFLASLVAFCFSLGLFTYKLIYGVGLEGWTSLALISTAIFLIQSFTLIAIGLYVAQIYTEVKSRPRYIKKRTSSN